MEWIESEKGGRKLVLDGYMYVKKRNLGEGWEVFECELRRGSRNQCKAWVKVLGDQVIHGQHDHAHPPDFGRVYTAKLKSATKRRAVYTNERPEEILQATIQQATAEGLHALIPNISSMKKTIQRHRKKTLQALSAAMMIQESQMQADDDGQGSQGVVSAAVGQGPQGVASAAEQFLTHGGCTYGNEQDQSLSHASTERNHETSGRKIKVEEDVAGDMHHNMQDTDITYDENEDLQDQASIHQVQQTLDFSNNSPPPTSSCHLPITTSSTNHSSVMSLQEQGFVRLGQKTTELPYNNNSPTPTSCNLPSSTSYTNHLSSMSPPSLSYPSSSTLSPTASYSLSRIHDVSAERLHSPSKKQKTTHEPFDETLRDHAEKEHNLKIAHLTEQHKLKMEVLLLEKKVQIEKLELIQLQKRKFLETGTDG